jgi:general secretion pathway protein G
VREKFIFWFLLAILGIVVFHAFKPRIYGSGPSHPVSAMADIHGGIQSALDAFKADTSFYPKGSNGLLELVQQPAGATTWRGPYLDKLPNDPWGHKYIYEFPGKHNTNGFDLFSAGPDCKPGTGDDIVNWTK